MDSLKVVVVASPFANMSPLYEVDPEADVLLIVPPNNKPFAPWNDASSGPGQVNGLGINSKASPPPSPGLRIKVSSKHLTLASRVFKNKLQHGSTRSSTQSDGRVHLTLTDSIYDPKAVTAVVNAVHGRGSKLKTVRVDLATLAQIALFTDTFQLFDTVEVYADRWIDKLLQDEGLPDLYGRDLVLWIFISHVFRRADVFKSVTKLAAVHSTGPIPDLGLPIREKLIKHIDAQRQELAGQAITSLHGAMDTLTSGAATCPKFQCDSFLLGELIKTLHKSKLVWPRPAKPLTGVSFGMIVAAVSSSTQYSESQRRIIPAAAELWNDAARSHPAAVLPSRKRKSPVQQPITPPDSSPEPVARSVPGSGAGGNSFESHDCAARKLMGDLDGLEALEDGVKGLELESSLGYQNY
ncbi:hypothetical protein B0H63DRAFT_555185 [Podospora didyma]|uniref:BTB domain-containing protein n=1 Tax=Podospora didyma TaxID=330526 RepID=A0AAE0P5Q5_9PEZI|nr:hypothetical protein B0H63DRAFT_555185 [Podospora didyma]